MATLLSNDTRGIRLAEHIDQSDFGKLNDTSATRITAAIAPPLLANASLLRAHPD